MRSVLSINSTHDGASSLSHVNSASYEQAKASLQTCDVTLRIHSAYHYVKTNKALAPLLPVVGELWARSHAAGVVYSSEDMAVLTTVELLQYGIGSHSEAGGNSMSRWEQEARSGNWSCGDGQDDYHPARRKHAA